MNKIGFNVLAWSAVISDELMPVIDRLQTVGYNGVEVLIGSDDEEAYKRLGMYTKNADLEVTTVFVIGKEEDPISKEAAVRAKALNRIKWAIDRAHDLNAKIISGPFHSAHRNFVHRAPEDWEYECSAEVLNTAGEYAAGAGIILGLEALNRFECFLCNTVDQLNRLLKTTNHPNVKAMFDTHHANIEEKKFKKAIDTIAPFLSHVHISENDRGTPGDGHINFDEIFSALAGVNYQGWLTIEAFSRNDPGFANSIGVWREYSKPWDIAEDGYKFIKRMCIKYGL